MDSGDQSMYIIKIEFLIAIHLKNVKLLLTKLICEMVVDLVTQIWYKLNGIYCKYGLVKNWFDIGSAYRLANKT